MNQQIAKGFFLIGKTEEQRRSNYIRRQKNVLRESTPMGTRRNALALRLWITLERKKRAWAGIHPGRGPLGNEREKTSHTFRKKKRKKTTKGVEEGKEKKEFSP